MTTEKIAVLGGGTWGATLAACLAINGHDVIIWEFNPEMADYLQKNRSLPTLKQLALPSSVQVTSDLAQAITGRSIILSVTPSQTVRSTFEKAVKSGLLQKKALVISASKGIENETCFTMSQVISAVYPEVGDIVVLSGPSHAEEVALKRPTGLVSASKSKASAERVKNLFTSEALRVYTSEDPLGVELGGAIKNVYAVACGVVDGLNLGDNTKAALMSRGLLEMTRLGVKMGAKGTTFFGLSGLGDLIVTCGSQHSRNRSVGEKIGKGKNLQQALAEMTMVAEGVSNTKSTHQLAQKQKVDMPIVAEMAHVLFENKAPQQSIHDLMARQTGAEMEGLLL